MAATHLNASVGDVLSPNQLAAALQAATLDVLVGSPKAAAAASYLFVEVDPRMIALCAYEAGTDIDHANMLYLDLLQRSMPRVIAWEIAVEAMLCSNFKGSI
ncbi:MAG: hypothetical protein WA071_20845 [Undibacterium umbellatum]|uniref:hypothetical protein n=1 Tax=Undibacterium umbellatum TaxID=2762300 RepID=UPI003BB7BB88